MTILNYFQIVSSIISLLGILFVIYLYFRNPQINSEKKETVFDLQIKQLQTDLTNLRDNHVHTLDVKLDTVQKDIGGIKMEMGKLATIIDERIPRKNT